MATINVLWYTGGVQLSATFSRNGASGLAGYKSYVNSFVTQAAGVGVNFTVTFWDSGAKPAGTFDVLVFASPYGNWDAFPSYTDLQTAIGNGSISISQTVNRVILTAADPDWHYMCSNAGSNIPTFPPTPSQFDSPFGFLCNGLQWCGSGTGMGLLCFGDGTGDGGGFTTPNFSFTGVTSGSAGANLDFLTFFAPTNPLLANLSTADCQTSLNGNGQCDWSSSYHWVFSSISSPWVGVTQSTTVTGYPTVSTNPVTPLTISCGNPQTGVVGTAYTASPSASGGSSPYTYSITSGALPPGLSMSSSTGAITGTPTATGAIPFYIFAITVTDANSATASVNCQIPILPSAAGKQTHLYLWQIQAVPDSVYNWRSQFISHGLQGYQHISRILATYSAGAAVTLSFSIYDGTAPSNITLAATNNVPQKVLLTLTSNKFRLIRYSASSSLAFQINLADWLVEVGEWGRAGKYVPYRMIGEG